MNSILHMIRLSGTVYNICGFKGKFLSLLEKLVEHEVSVCIDLAYKYVNVCYCGNAIADLDVITEFLPFLLVR